LGSIDSPISIQLEL